MESSGIASAEKLKDDGNEAYSRGELKEAIDCYTQALELEPEKKLKATLYRNRAMVRLKMDDFEGCETDATRGQLFIPVLQVDRFHVFTLSSRLTD